MKLEGKVVIAQGGGPTAVINQSLVGVVLESRKFSQVSRVYGAVNGVTGILNEDFVDLTQETTHNLEQVAITPSSALFSTREKPDEKFCKEMFRVIKAHDAFKFYLRPLVGSGFQFDISEISPHERRSSANAGIPLALSDDKRCRITCINRNFYALVVLVILWKIKIKNTAFSNNTFYPDISIVFFDKVFAK